MIEKFESGYETTETEITVLLEDGCTGAWVMNNDWLCPSVDFIACIYQDSEEVSKEEGRIEWLLEKEASKSGWGYDFEKYGIYRLLVRKCIPKELEPYQSASANNRYMLIKVLESDVKNEKLLAIKSPLLKPVFLETTYGQFELNRSFSWFSADIKLGETKVNVAMQTDIHKGETAHKALSTFHKIAKNFEEFDLKNKESAADYLLDLANEWYEESEDYEEDEFEDEDEAKPAAITKEMFMDAIELSEMVINVDGSMTLYYLDGNMFWGHAIEMDIEPDGTCSDANIAG